jgi:hypothetical protein
MTTALDSKAEDIAGQTTLDGQPASHKGRDAERTTLANQAYNAAWGRIRDKYREEYDRVLDEEFAKRNVTRRKRATSAEKAEREARERLARAEAAVRKLLAEFPELATKVQIVG